MPPTQSEIPRFARNDTAGRFFHTFRGFPQVRRQSRFFTDFDATLRVAQWEQARETRLVYNNKSPVSGTGGCSLSHSGELDLVGRTLAHYRINAAIGAGGMGEVYRATDMKLGRDVALKVLPPNVANDPERLARFQREARAIAALNHPNVVTLYSVEEFAPGVACRSGPHHPPLSRKRSALPRANRTRREQRIPRSGAAWVALRLSFHLGAAWRGCTRLGSHARG